MFKRNKKKSTLRRYLESGGKGAAIGAGIGGGLGVLGGSLLAAGKTKTLKEVLKSMKNNPREIKQALKGGGIPVGLMTGGLGGYTGLVGGLLYQNQRDKINEANRPLSGIREKFKSKKRF